MNDTARYCSSCGEAVALGAGFCSKCGAAQAVPQTAATQASLPGTAPIQSAVSSPQVKRGRGNAFWFVALAITVICIGLNCVTLFAAAVSAVVGFIAYRRRSWSFGAVAATGLFFMLIGMAMRSGPPSDASATVAETTDAPAPVEPEEKIVVRDLNNGAFSVVVGRKYHLQEGMTDSEWAKSLILARMVGNRDGIETAYHVDSYRHYGNDGEGNEPLCAIDDQDPIETDTTDALNSGGPKSPIACHLDDGSQIYATALQE